MDIDRETEILEEAIASCSLPSGQAQEAEGAIDLYEEEISVLPEADGELFVLCVYSWYFYHFVFAWLWKRFLI